MGIALFLALLGGGASAALADSLTIKGSEASQQPFLARGTLSKLGTQIAEFVEVPAAGNYKVTVRASGRQKNGVWPRLGMTVDGFATGNRAAESSVVKPFTFEAQLEAGAWLIGVQMLNETDGLFDATALTVESIAIEPAAGGTPVAISTQEKWLADAQARDAAVLAAADAAIQKNRVGSSSIELVDAAGKPVSGATVEAKLSNHAFLFGCNIAGLGQFHDAKKDTAYKDQFAALFNYATVPLYWKYLEPAKGRIDYPRVDAMVDWCAAQGIAMKGHPLLWDSEFGVPGWATLQPDETTQREHVEGILGKYAKRIPYWEVVNEPANHPGVKLMPAQGWARAKAPEAVLIVNEYGPFFNGHPAFRELLEKAKKDGAPFDAVGIQAHAPADMAFPFARVTRVLDSYAALGTRVHITEFTPPSAGGNISGAAWRGAWSEDTQAQYAEEMYKVLFAHPAVDAISWWDFSDQGAWIPNGGLLHADATPKPAYTSLKNLVHETWSSNTEATTDASGHFDLHGYFGSYTLKITRSGKTQEAQVELKRDAAPLRVTLK